MKEKELINVVRLGFLLELYRKGKGLKTVVLLGS
jgi:hypothetical protein